MHRWGGEYYPKQSGKPRQICRVAEKIALRLGGMKFLLLLRGERECVVALRPRAASMNRACPEVRQR
jgi:hypothetical protein